MKKLLLLIFPLLLSWNTTKAQTALQFDGIDDYVSIGNPSVLNFESNNTLTLEVWFKTTGGGMMLSKMYNSAPFRGYELQLAGGTVNFFLCNNWTTPSLWVLTTNTYNDGNWHHAAVTYNGSGFASGVVIYVDGVSVPISIAQNSLGSNSVLTSAPLLIGTRAGAANFPGKLDQVRIWNVVRTPSEISLNMNNCLSGSEPGLVALYDFEEGSGTILTDKTSNGNNGNILNSPAWVTGMSCTSPCTDPTVPTITASANPVCASSTTTLNIAGTLNDATQWAIYTGSCGGTLVGTTSTSSFVVTPSGPSTTYFVRGEGGCVTPGSCGSLAVNVTNITLAALSQTNISCNGGSNGAAAVNTATGGTGPYTYNWTPGNPPGDGTTSVTGLTAGTWSCTVTDANGCTKVTSFTITQPSAISSSLSSQANVSCNGGSNGSATVTVSGGTPSYTYSWAPSGGTAATATGLTAGTYTCTITDANGCNKTQSATITQPSAISSSLSSQTNVSCNGGSNGSATVAVSGGTPSYTYSWAPSGGTAATATGLSAGTYTCTITDTNGCTKTQSATITQPTAIASSLSSQTNVACNSGATGSVTVAVSGGTPGYTYSWAPTGGTAVTATGLTAGTYTCTITDANGCTKTQSATITQPSTITSSISAQSNVSCNGGSNGSATVTVSGGTPGYTYSWAPSGGTAATASGLSAGTYTCTITDANGCTKTQSVTLTQPSNLTATSTQSNVSCFGGSNGSASVTATGGALNYTYTWSPTGGTSATATGLFAGTYSCTITDTNGCSITKSFTITQPSSAITSSISALTNIACNGGTNGTATISATGGTGVYTYSWAPSGGSAATASGLSAGTYTCTITDANGCTKTQSATITQPTAITSSISAQSNVSCNSGSNGSATVTVSGGTPGYTYSWAPSGGTAATTSGLPAGTYTCTITDANGCSKTQSVTLTQPSNLTATSTQTNVSCFGGSNGSASVTATGGALNYTYNWSPIGGTAATATNLSPGAYSCSITDANGCQTSKNFTITQPSAITSSISSQTNVACNGGATGAATVSVSGGTSGYTYSWSPSGGTAATASGLSAGTYTCTITDANGCTKTQSVTITQSTAIVASAIIINNVSCNNGSDGGATASLSGGTAPYTYFWSNAATTPSITGVAAGTYNVTITDANGCSDITSITITQPTAINNTISEITSGVLTSNEISAISYQWYECPNTLLTGETNQNFEPTSLGDYKVVVTVNSCVVESACYTVTTLDIESFENVTKFIIYPNPANGLLNINSSFDGDFVIVNQLGQTVHSFKVNSNIENTINVDNLADGIYFIKGISDTKVKSQKLIIKK